MSELLLHRQVVGYLRYQYPDVIFRTDYAAGQHKQSMYHRRMHKELQAGRAFPDLFIAEMRRGYGGCFLELKKEGTTIIRKTDGELTKDKHIREQKIIGDDLAKRGYFTAFAVGLEQAKKLIDWYLRDEEVTSGKEELWTEPKSVGIPSSKTLVAGKPTLITKPKPDESLVF